MFTISRTDAGIEIKNEKYYLWIIFLSIFMGAMTMVGVFAAVAQNNFNISVGIALAVVYTLLLPALFLYSYVESSVRIVIDNDGVLKSNIWQSMFIPWCEIEDYGISFDMRGQYRTIYYYLYFSRSKCMDKNVYSKKLRGKMIKYQIDQHGYKKILKEVIPYCTDKAVVVPFVGKEKK